MLLAVVRKIIDMNRVKPADPRDLQFRKPRLHDHKLRKFLSIKLDFEYLKFYWTHCDLNKMYKSLKFRFINKTTAKVILKFEILT